MKINRRSFVCSDSYFSLSLTIPNISHSKVNLSGATITDGSVPLPSSLSFDAMPQVELVLILEEFNLSKIELVRECNITLYEHGGKKVLFNVGDFIKCPRAGQNRTVYSLRYTYATFALINDGMDIHALAIQMGTSIGMIERHYSHLTSGLKKDMRTGKRYRSCTKEFEKNVIE